MQQSEDKELGIEVEDGLEVDDGQLSREEIEKIPGNFLNKVNMLQTRAIYMAGFSYYAIGYYQSSCCASRAYVIFNTAAFVLSLCTSGTACIFSYYIQRHKTVDEKIKFCMEAIGFERMLLTVFLLATTCFLIGIGLLGFAYYPHSFYTLVPLTVMFFAAVIYLCITLYTVQNQLKFQTNFGIGKAEWFVDIKKIVNDSIYHDRTGEPLQDFVVKQASAVSGRAIFIAGLGQYGIMRYSPSPVVFNAKDSNAHAFLMFITFTCATAFLAGSILSVFQIFIPGTVKKKQLAFTIMLMPLFRFSLLCYVVAFLSLFFSNIFVGNGTNYTSMGPSTPVLGTLGLIMLAYSFYSVLNVEKDIAAGETDTLQPQEEGDKASTELDERIVSAKMSTINTAGAMSTFAAGYVYYNITTFDDVLALTWNSNADADVRLFLWANLISLTLAALAAVLDTILTVTVNNLRSVQQKKKFLDRRAVLVRCCAWFYYISLVGWFCVFALFGPVKFSRMWYGTVWYAGVGILVMVAGGRYLQYEQRRCTALAHNMDTTSEADEFHKRHTEWMAANADQYDVSISRPKILNSIAFPVLFLGGFAYYAVDFFDWNDRTWEYEYLHLMCICFVTSMWVMAFADRYSYQMSKLFHPIAKLEFGQRTLWFYKMCVTLSYIVVISLLLGFLCLGDIKTCDNYKEVRGVITVGVFLLILFIVPVVWKILKVYDVVEKQCLSARSIEVEEKHGSVSRFTSQVSALKASAGFICGSVCYEILYSDANSTHALANMYYFFMLSLTFGFAMAVIIVSTITDLCLGELPRLDQKYWFVRILRDIKLVVFSLSIGCIISWQMTVIALGNVKYVGNKAFDLPSTLGGFIGLAFLIYVFIRIKDLSNRTLHGDTEVDYNRKTAGSLGISRTLFFCEWLVGWVAGSGTGNRTTADSRKKTATAVGVSSQNPMQQQSVKQTVELT